ncbi:MAG: hypothetical protein JWM16_1726, partial [Verrucomicrobiales bacterium]|nr:hypothetical protein [Verrucomicrobiales bacterium]
ARKPYGKPEAAAPHLRAARQQSLYLTFHPRSSHHNLSLVHFSPMQLLVGFCQKDQKFTKILFSLMKRSQRGTM